MDDQKLIIEIFCSVDYKALPQIRQQIRTSMEELGILPVWHEYYPGIGSLPAHIPVDSYPILLINGQCITIDSFNGQQIVTANLLQGVMLNSQKWLSKKNFKELLKAHLSFLSATIIAFFPKCPFCWAVYMSLLSFLGVSKIPYQPWLLPIFIALFFVNIFSMYRNGSRHQYRPLIISLAGAVIIVFNRLLLDVTILNFVAGILLVSASLWNSLSKRMANSVRGYFLRPLKNVGFF